MKLRKIMWKIILQRNFRLFQEQKLKEKLLWHIYFWDLKKNKLVCNNCKKKIAKKKIKIGVTKK